MRQGESGDVERVGGLEQDRKLRVRRGHDAGSRDGFGQHRLAVLAAAVVENGAPIDTSGDLNGAKFADLASAGVNRVSIGLQSVDDDALRFLGRLHNSDEGIECGDR